MSTAYFKVSRKTAAVLTVLAMVLGLFPMAAFAAGPFTDVSGTLADQINKAANAGLVDGYGDGTFRPNENVSRAAFAKMIVLAVEKATGKELASGTENFTDVVPSQALYAYVVKAATAGWIDGYEDDTFRPDQPITRGQAAKIVQRALNLADAAEGFTDVPDNHQFAKAIGAVSAAGIITGYNSTTFKPNDNITRGQAAAVAYRAYDHLLPKKLAVKSVSAVNLKQIRIEFTKAVDVDSAKDISNYEFASGNNSLADLTDATASAQVVGDRTVYITFNTERNQQETAKVRVDGVAAADDKNDVLTSDVYQVKFFDTAEPTYTGQYAFVAPNTVRLFFSEPIKTASASSFSMDNGTLAVAQANPGIDGDKYYVDVVAGGTIADGSHVLKIAAGGVVDYAGFMNEAIEATLNLAAPKANVTVSVVSASQTGVRLKFSVPINKSLLDTSLFYHSFSSYNPDAVVADGTYADVVDLTFTTHKIPEGTVTLVVLKQNQAGTKKIVDAFGNTLASDSVSLQLNVVADKVAPSVVAVKAEDADTVTVEFSEAVNEGDAETAANYTIKNAAGQAVSVSVTPTLSNDGKVVTLQLSNPLNGGNYTLEVRNIRDRSVSENKLTSASVAFIVKDTIAPTLQSATLHADGRTITVQFSEQVESASATNVSNYQLSINGSTSRIGLPNGTTATLDASGTRVTLVLGAGVNGLDGTDDTLYVANIKDLTGTQVPFGNSVAISAASEPALATSPAPAATSTNTVVVYFNQALAGVNANNVTLGAGTTKVAGATFENVTIGGQVLGKVTVTLPSAIKTDKSDLQDILFGTGSVIAATGKSNGSAIKVEADTVADRIAPALVSTNPVTISGTTVTIQYTEAISSTSVAVTTYTVEGYRVDSVTVSGNTVTLTVTATSSPAVTEPAVKQVAAVRDANGNEMAPWSAAVTAKAVSQ